MTEVIRLLVVPMTRDRPVAAVMVVQVVAVAGQAPVPGAGVLPVRVRVSPAVPVSLTSWPMLPE